MELRQIVRDQKLINFDLSSLISEAPPTPAQQAANQGLTHAGSGYYIDNTGKTVAQTVKGKLVPISGDEDTEAPDDQAGAERGPQVMQDPDNKDIEALGTDFNTDVDIEDDLRVHINSELALVGLKPSRKDKNVFVDEPGKKLMMINPDGDVVPGEDIEDIPSRQRKRYTDAVDDINAQLKSDVKPAEKDDEKVDEPTDTKPQARVQGNITKESIDAIDGKQKRLALQLKAKAPGNPSSAINEIMTGDGMVMFSDDPDRSVEDVAEELFKRTKNTPLGKKNGEEKTRAACVAAAISAKRENVRAQEFLASEEMDADTTEISHVWGSQESLQATVDTLEEAGVKEVNGIPLKDADPPPSYEDIIKEGGEGANPTDTMVVMIDSSKKPPKAIILHTSNKTSTGDIQANSSPDKNIEAMIGFVEASDLPDKKKKTIIEAAEETRKDLIKKQKEIASIVTNSFGKARDKLESGELISELKTLSKPPADPEKYWKIMQKRYTTAKPGPGGHPRRVEVEDPLTKQNEKDIAEAYLDEMEYLATTDDEVKPPTGDMNTILARTALGEEEEERMVELYQEQHNMQNQLRLKMNKISDGIGDRAMAKNFMSRLHLDVAEGHAPGGIPPQYFELNMGHNNSGVRYDDDGQAYMKVGKKFYPVDVETGEVDEDAESKTANQLNSGSTATVGNMDTIAAALGYEIPPRPENIDELIEVGDVESAAAGPGGQAFIYGIRQSDGQRIVIGVQSIRPKDGKGTVAQDTLKWALEFQTRLQLASAREAKQESGEQPKKESIRFLGTVIYETKQNTLSHHLTKSEEDYSVDQFIREINEGSLN